jgi:malate dehydrogenase
VKITGTSDWRRLRGRGRHHRDRGRPRKPGQSRDDLVAINLPIIRSVADGAKEHCPNAFVVVISNPLDAMVYELQRRTGFPKEKVVGMAGVLDSARFSLFLAREVGLKRKDVRAMVLGGHGDDMVPILSATARSTASRSGSFVPKEKLDAIIARTRGGGGEIVKLMGTSAYYAPASAAMAMAESYLSTRSACSRRRRTSTASTATRTSTSACPSSSAATASRRSSSSSSATTRRPMLAKSAASVQGIVDVVKKSA